MNVDTMSMPQKLEFVLRKGCALLPGDAGRRILALLSPEALAIMAGVVAIWAASHFVGVGELADVVLLAVGWLTIGGAAIDGSRKLIAFAVGTYNAHTEADMNAAAQDFADAISILGVDVVLGLLLKGKPKGTFSTVHKPHQPIPGYGEFVGAMPRGGPFRMYEAQLIFTRSRQAGDGGTNLKNVARVGRAWWPESGMRPTAMREMRKAAHHETIHLRLNQAFSILGRPALYLKMGAYKRSYILRYIEEAAAETYALAKVKGRQPNEIAGYRFPLGQKYDITVAKMGEEANGILLGPVTVGGAVHQVFHGQAHEPE